MVARRKCQKGTPGGNVGLPPGS